ncbi:DNA-directed RNA polymerase subunit alpha [bacterium]|nr:MAG: DNA-directed RNA polymerase subunit alpha [bacterium]
MKSIPLPNKIYFSLDEKNISSVVIEPLYPGYGVTIGNALRRVLLSSLPGAAVTAVKIKGVDHEFSTIPNVREDVVDIILNLKQLRLKVHSEEPVKLELKSKGQKNVTAADIRADANVEIVNPDLLIATLDNKNAELSMELIVEQGRGYVPVEMRESEKMEIGMIAVDAIYTPVRNVNFEVENVRVGRITNYDKLTLTMETDGTISGQEALDMVSQILVDHFSMLLTANLEQMKIDNNAEETPAVTQLPLDMAGSADERPVVTEVDDLATLGLSNRAHNALERNNIKSIAKLRGMTRDELGGLEGLGDKSIDEILEVLAKYNK